MAEETVIPPVQTGQIESSIDFEYDSDTYGDGGFSGRGTHTWEFDHSAYVDATGLHIGADWPYVPQENGHALRLETEYTWMYSDYDDEDSYTLLVEQSGVRGTYSYEYYFTRCGYYRLDETMTVIRSKNDPQPYRQRESDREIPHFDVWNLDGVSVDRGEELVRGLHSGVYGPPIDERFQTLITFDTPEDAIPAMDYQHDEQMAAGD